MRRYLDAQPVQTCEGRLHRRLDFRSHDMESDLQMADGGLIDFRRGALDQSPDQLTGDVEVTSQELTFRTFEPQAKRQLVLIAPVPFIQQRHAGRKILA